jgi:hypothetical protein
MKDFRLLIAFLWLTACASSTNDEVKPSDANTIEVKLINNLAVDGCDWHFAARIDINSVKYYVASTNSRSKVEPLIQASKGVNGIHEIDVILKYQPTNNTQKVRCGWGKFQDYEEIEVLDIKKK